VQWRVALRWYVLYGFRTQELIAFESDHRPLLWSDLYPAGLSPAQGGQVVCEHGWLKYVPQKQEGKKPDPLVLPLHPEAVSWVDRLRLPLLGAVSCDRPVFAWPRSSSQFYAAWGAIAARAAEILGKPAVAEYAIKHLRKTCATWHETLAPGIAEHITGHGDRSVIQRHYVNHERMLVDHFSKFVFPQQGGLSDANADTEGRGGSVSGGSDRDPGDTGD
jgi:integrase